MRLTRFSLIFSGDASRKADGSIEHKNATTEFDLTEKSITPMGGFPHYGVVNNDFLLIKGQVMGVKKRPVILRKSIHPTTRPWMNEHIELKFIDTASKIGHGRFQTFAEKEKILGPRKARE